MNDIRDKIPWVWVLLPCICALSVQSEQFCLNELSPQFREIPTKTFEGYRNKGVHQFLKENKHLIGICDCQPMHFYSTGGVR